ncbi:MAG: HDOD domain-containing protein [Acidimicrobiales bacterium]
MAQGAAVSPAGSAQVERLLAAMEQLPSRANAALRVLWLADDPTTSLADLAAAVEADPALTARLLALANSAYYSPRSHVSNVSRAITVLGFATVRTVATTAACGLSGRGATPKGFWEHAAAAANACQLLAWRYGAQSGEAFALGLLHDLGRGLLFQADREGSAAVDAAVAKGGDRLALERERFGLTHADAAARVLVAWRFPPGMTAAIALHHDRPELDSEPLERLIVAAEAVVAIANPIDDEPVVGDHELASLTLAADRLSSIVERVREEAESLAGVLAG